MYTINDLRDMVLDFMRRTVPELKYQEIDTSAPVEDLGVTSIDMLEVVSAAMRKLGIDVPRDALGDLETIDDLVKLLNQVLVESQTPAG